MSVEQDALRVLRDAGLTDYLHHAVTCRIWGGSDGHGRPIQRSADYCTCERDARQATIDAAVKLLG